jgi:serine/threonine-protein kinase
LRDGSLSPAETITMLAPVADALDAAHAAGVVHRDVTPGNILLEGFGAFLCDFGLARRAESVSGFSRDDGLTVSGTLGYVAPEQLEGDTVDGRTDQYALACVLFECLAVGRRSRGTSSWRRLRALVGAATQPQRAQPGASVGGRPRDRAGAGEAA